MQTSYLFLALSISLGAVGQILLKNGALQAGIKSKWFFHPSVAGGLGVYFLAALLYTYALRKVPLSVAFPSVSLSYVIVSFLAHLIWGEVFGLRQIAALGLIGSGIFLLIRSSN